MRIHEMVSKGKEAGINLKLVECIQATCVNLNLQLHKNRSYELKCNFCWQLPHMYVCIKSISVQLNPRHFDAQLPAVCRCRARQLGSTVHHHWPQICSLYHLIALTFTPLCAKWLLTGPLFWLQPFTLPGLGLCPYP